MGANAFLHCILISKVCFKLHLCRIEIKGKLFFSALAKTFAKSHFSCRATGKQHFWGTSHVLKKAERVGWYCTTTTTTLAFFGRPYVVSPSDHAQNMDKRSWPHYPSSHCRPTSAPASPHRNTIEKKNNLRSPFPKIENTLRGDFFSSTIFFSVWVIGAVWPPGGKGASILHIRNSG